MKLTSIIILNWNGFELTRQCIESIHGNTPKGSFEIIVVDNGSNERDVSGLRELKRKGLVDVLIENASNKGFAGANNQGMRVAHGDFLLLLNNDTIVTKGWLEALVGAAESNESIGIVGPHLPESPESKTVYGGGFVGLGGIARHDFVVRPHEAEQVGGAAFFFKRSVFERIGELDENFYPIYFEESDYCARARKAGFKVWFAPESTVVHFGSKITKKQPSKWMFVALNKNRVRYMLLHFSLPMLLLSIPFEAGRITKSVFCLRLHWLLKAYWENLLGLPEIIGKRLRYRKGSVKVIN